ncbi:unnamed protein product [Rotaria magnacalcarata]|uniref:beta-N-acetylhexosaminidase n=2 Tax=Rotaria magnacalcarata TaxID=392030 RepID=A0A815V020_9BILA|nr:unnamed protein product [Rotaria magnacalcarata]CAF4614598.1 unnamed protein product [Rotaria magnacalcarata]
MLKAVSIVTCLAIISIYFLLINIIYPYVCWSKHRPSDDDSYISPPTATLINKRLTRVCSNRYRFNLMPMPSKIISSNRATTIRIPSMIRIEIKHSLPFPIPKSFNNASFILSIEYEYDMNNNSYPTLGIDESYQLNITSNNRAFLCAKTYVGILRGLSTFEQLQSHEKVPIPLAIFDKPRFIWRGLMLDVARHFIPISIIQKTINFMHLVKMNVLHLHLSDDQGFRLESKRFPRLHDSHEFYSQSDMQNLIEYARQRAIRIVPEFDMPAHTSAWFIGYPHLASTQKSSYHLETTWGVKNATMDVTRPSTYDFLDKFFSEMTQLFPDPYFHIGGDECEPYEWMESEQIQKFLKQKRLYSHQDLQAYFNRRIEKILKKYNRTMMGWDEISASNFSKESIIQSWRNKNSLFDAIYQGYHGILSHGFYLDHMASAEYHYSNDLTTDNLFDTIKQKRFLGGEACLWTEYIDANMVHSRAWPRTAAIAERLWSTSSDEIECMYDRLAFMDKTFFHPNDEKYIRDLSRLTSNVNALKLLADLCEPLGLQGRDHTRNYTSRTPLNRFVDILKPESEQARQLIKTRNVSQLYSTFVSWKMNHLHIRCNDSDVLQLSENLARLSEIGLRLLKLLSLNEQRQIVSSRWYYYQVYILNTLEYQVPEIRLAGVRVLRDLLEQFDPCSFDLVNLSLIVCFPIIVILAQRVGFIRRHILLPSLNFFYYCCGRC